MRVWVDLTNTAHVLVLRPLVELLEQDGHEVEITARPLSHTLELLDDWGHPYTTLGEYGGVSRGGKARAAAGRVAGMLRFGGGGRQAGGARQGRGDRQVRGRREGPGRGSGRRTRFDAAVAHGSTDLPMACRLLRIPNSTMFDYEWAALQH